MGNLKPVPQVEAPGKVNRSFSQEVWGSVLVCCLQCRQGGGRGAVHGVGLPRTVFRIVTFPRGTWDLPPLGQEGQVIKEHALCGLLALAREWSI